MVDPQARDAAVGVAEVITKRTDQFGGMLVAQGIGPALRQEACVGVSGVLVVIKGKPHGDGPISAAIQRVIDV
ncbi:hypothetical protein [Novosphingobium sp. SG707]|uniref:hypothetical protein n=1 Tax=Novosphingobium sp. SG707 TaxID=2586996 RepID=UPI0014466852|nr:hypothetical protein [Novosphingobium sp. SG707]NKJ02054.1 hypothetical protein [Novosphingobium sp. SG707]